MKFRRISLEIEAVQFNKQNEPFPEEFEKAICREHHFGMIDPVRPHIHTLEGNHYIQENDWIVKGVKGEFYPVKPDIFALSYEPEE